MPLQNPTEHIAWVGCYSNTPSMILDALHCIANHRQSLSREDARTVMSEVLSGKCTDAQIGALLTALHMKGETVDEIVGFAEAIRIAAPSLTLEADSTLDMSGTERDALVDRNTETKSSGWDRGPASHLHPSHSSAKSSPRACEQMMMQNVLMPPLSRDAGGWIPLGPVSVALFLEMATGNERLVQIHRIVHHCRDH